MSETPRDQYTGGAHQFHLAGDIFPTNVDYSDPQYTPELFKMYHRNEFVQIMCDWMTGEAFRNWIKFVEDSEPVQGLKFGEEYTFKGYDFEDDETGKRYVLSPFNEYVQWNDVPTNWKLGVAWSRLYGQGALLVFLDNDESLIKVLETKDKNIIEWKKNSDPKGYQKFRVYQPFDVGTGTGFKIENKEGHIAADGSVLKWTVQIQTNYKKSKTLIIDAERCVHLLWKKKQNGWKAASRVASFLRFAKMEELTFQKLTKRAHDLAGGILHIDGVGSQPEQDAIDAAMGSDLTSVDRIYTQAGRTVEYKTPDLKAAGEFATIFELYTKKLIRFMRIDQLMLDGEHTGASMGGNDNVQQENAYTEIHDIQEHYRNYLEKVFYKLGKTNTSFVYREIRSEEKEMQDEMIEFENTRTEQADRANADSNQRDGQQNGDKSAASDREQTR